MATPETVWSARKVIDATACKIENIADTTIATSNASQGVQAPNVSAKVRLNKIPMKAPITMSPSNPMLTTPERSENTPPIAVKIRGAAYAIEIGTMK